MDFNPGGFLPDEIIIVDDDEVNSMFVREALGSYFPNVPISENPHLQSFKESFSRFLSGKTNKLLLLVLDGQFPLKENEKKATEGAYKEVLGLVQSVVNDTTSKVRVVVMPYSGHSSGDFSSHPIGDSRNLHFMKTNKPLNFDQLQNELHAIPPEFVGADPVSA